MTQEIDTNKKQKVRFLKIDLKTIHQLLAIIKEEIEVVNNNPGWFDDPKRLGEENLLCALWSLTNNGLSVSANKKVVSPQDLFQDLQCILLLSRLANSILTLKNIKTRIIETRKLINSESFSKSEYVLYIASLFAANGHIIEIYDRGNNGGPDILVDDKLFVECKQRDVRSKATLRDRLIDAREQLDNVNGHGIACIDFPAGYEINKEIDNITQEVSDELSLSCNINFCVVTQTLRPELRNTKFGFPVRVGIFPHPEPSKLHYKCTNFNIEDVFGEGTLVNLAIGNK